MDNPRSRRRVGLHESTPTVDVHVNNATKIAGRPVTGLIEALHIEGYHPKKDEQHIIRVFKEEAEERNISPEDHAREMLVLFQRHWEKNNAGNPRG